MDIKIRNRIDREIKDRFYYIEFPNNVPERFWKDGDGKYKNMESMTLDHLQHSIQRVEKDKESFLKQYLEALDGPEIMKELLPLVDEKLKELKEIFNKKAKM